ncbi:hypothetical protein JEM65_08845 [Gelidibacter salicanalis]|uniref:Uncharacterized protein n=1 Tax=Gelidibacter salicanalis TaxID=291193 RepID=A0A934KU73_9FLAO|nr:hypothetical protein [Gelidibacter salicanalis]
MTDLNPRGLEDTLFSSTDNLKGFTQEIMRI